MPTGEKVEVKGDSTEHKVNIARLFLKAMPTKEDFDLICKMSDEARRHKFDMDEKAAHYALRAQIAAKHSSDLEYERWSMKMTLNRWNRV